MVNLLLNNKNFYLLREKNLIQIFAFIFHVIEIQNFKLKNWK